MADTNVPGKHYRKGMTIMQIADVLPTDDTARRWFESECWPEGPGPSVTPKNSCYQPSRKELRSDATIPASPKQAMKAVAGWRPTLFEKRQDAERPALS